MQQRTTKQQQAIEGAVVAAGRPLSPQEIHEAARADVPTLSLATVYRGIRRMTEDGSLHMVEIPGQPPRYETTAAASEHHHHFHCTRCDRVFDVHGCAGGMSKLAPPGFTVTGHEITLYGLCEDCSG